MEIIQIFLTFLKIGALGFGGGYAMIPLIQQEVIANGWLTVQQFTDIVAVSQVTPGLIAVNMAAFVGYTQANALGAMVATIGICLPSFIFISILLKFFNKFNEKKSVQYVFSGLRPAALGLILGSAIILAWAIFFPETTGISLNITYINIKGILIFAIAFFTLYRFKLNPIFIVLISAIIGVVIY